MIKGLDEGASNFSVGKWEGAVPWVSHFLPLKSSSKAEIKLSVPFFEWEKGKIQDSRPILSHRCFFRLCSLCSCGFDDPFWLKPKDPK